MKIVKVNSSEELLKFVKFPFKLYKDSKYWVPPIIKEEINSFTKGVNPNLEDCDVNLFLAILLTFSLFLLLLSNSFISSLLIGMR